MNIAAVYGSTAAHTIGELHQYQPPRLPAPWPHQVGTIPPQAACFQDRNEAARLAEALTRGGAALVTQAQRAVVVGLGGVGKTQLAADYARTAWQAGEVDVLVWITAATTSAIVDSYARAATELLGSAAPDDPEQAAAAFLAWLQPKVGQARCRWLMILDDVTDPDHLSGLWPPDSPDGRTLVTTRSHEPALTSGRRLIPVGVFTPDESLAYLTTAFAAHHLTESDDELAALAHVLGHLPLALAQAAAYIAELADADMDCAQYRQLLADRTSVLRDAAPDRLPDGQALTVAATWSLSIDRADTLRPTGLARPMLGIAAFLDANGIPETVLTSAPARTYLAQRRTTYTGLVPTADGPVLSCPSADPAEGQDAVAVPERDARKALSALRRLSLIDRSPAASYTAVRVHQLIQRATRDTLTPSQHHRTAHAAADALLAAWPDVERDTALAQALRANTTALSTCANEALYQPGVHAALYRNGQSLGEAGRASAARDYFRDLYVQSSTHLGSEHPDTLTARHNLARWQGEAGDVEGAAEAFAEVVEHMVRVLGPDHPHTLKAQYNLAYWRGAAGDAVGAADAFTGVVEHMTRVLGPDHLGTLKARHNLAYWRGAAGDAAGAAHAFTKVVEHMTRALGRDHPYTLKARHNTARWQGEAGDAVGAANTFAEVLEHMVRVLGPDHRYALKARHNLAYWRGAAGDTAAAADATAAVLERMVRVLGPDHPYTLKTQGNLAYWRGAAGDTAAAADATAEVLEHMERVLGPDHPDTLITQDKLSHWRRAAEREGRPSG